MGRLAGGFGQLPQWGERAFLARHRRLADLRQLQNNTATRIEMMVHNMNRYAAAGQPREG